MVSINERLASVRYLLLSAGPWQEQTSTTRLKRTLPKCLRDPLPFLPFTSVRPTERKNQKRRPAAEWIYSRIRESLSASLRPRAKILHATNCYHCLWWKSAKHRQLPTGRIFRAKSYPRIVHLHLCSPVENRGSFSPRVTAPTSIHWSIWSTGVTVQTGRRGPYAMEKSCFSKTEGIRETNTNVPRRFSPTLFTRTALKWIHWEGSHLFSSHYRYWFAIDRYVTLSESKS